MELTVFEMRRRAGVHGAFNTETRSHGGRTEKNFKNDLKA
jgi:hypothetical protein